jgi:CheY-like chemotaxis protein
MESSTLMMGTRVREALHNITGLIELASEGPLSAAQIQYLSRCRESADELARTVNDIAELDRSCVVSKIVPFATADAVADVAELMKSLANDKALEFDWTTDPAVPTNVFGDRSILQDTLRRLLDNAIRFTQSGSVRLSVTATDLGADSALLRFEISDTGPGFDENLLSNPEPAGGFRARGLGLQVVRKRLTLLHGEFSLLANSQSGATVCFTMPVLIAGRASASGACYQAGSASGPPMAILIAEDSDKSFRLFQAYTKAEGHLTSRASNGAQAVEMFKSGEYDFIVMDVNMPVMDGYTATRLIREWETAQGRARLPILLFSADDEGRQSHMGATVGCSGYLTKPATKEQVLAALNFYAQPASNRREKTI